MTGAQINGADRRALDLLEGPPNAIAVTAQHVELGAQQLRVFERVEIARIRIFGDQSESAFFAGTADHEHTGKIGIYTAFSWH